VIDEAVHRVWPAGVDSVEALGGGITNHNFKVSVGGELFVLRIGGRDTALLGIDRSVEHAASLAAAALGVGPEVVAFVEPEGYLVTRFVEGEVGQVTPDEAAPLLRRFHDGPPIAGRFDPFRVAGSYAETARAAGIALPPPYADAKETADLIERRLGARPLAPCHNDLLAANFIHGGERLWIVDWEYAGMGDPAFDLANFSVSNGLDNDGDRLLLGAYGGGDPDVHVLMRFVSDYREAMWGVVQQAVSDLDFDFAGYAEEHFERLARTAAEPRFRRHL
jgi:aminoglycoside phosphotransferase (APT) family kinase protein